MYQTIRQPGAQSSQSTQIPVGLQLGTGVRPISTARIHVQGAIQQTGNDLDVGISGSGFFQILMPDGTTAYTRDGSFHRDNQGQMVTASGYPVSPSINIPPDTTQLTISRDGIVTVVQNNDAKVTTEIGQIQLATFINNGGLLSVGENLFLETTSSGAPTPNTPGTNGAGILQHQYVETSNVNVAEELVSMIQTQRAYEINSKVVSTSDQMLGRLTQL